FRHYEQSLRVVDILEKDGQGLNLTMEVRDGILRHSKGKGEIILKDERNKPLTKEAEVVRVADIIAYINHDIDDATRGNVIAESDLPEDSRAFLGRTTSKRIDSMVRGVIHETTRYDDLPVTFGEELEYHIVKLRDFLYERVYDSGIVHGDFIKCSRIIEDLYAYFLKTPDALFAETGKDDYYDDPSVCVCDFVSGMSDRYAFMLFEKIFLPLPWKIPV
ncbi:MAG: deoxyguanosinetriphosphate triphosphohydrolase, partial [Proteobacteria bacterium]|nr:deoxyguanosinetriphosphate triphosphohydrolase [Pseudomonadota bacterium]